MKKIIYLVLLLATKVIAQDYAAYELPEYTAVVNDSTDVLYIDDSGIDKHIKMPTLINLVSDSVAALRSIMGSASGTVDTVGLPVHNEVAYWNGATDLASSSELIYYADSFKVDANLYMTDTAFATWLNLSAGDTVALLAMGSKERMDSASLTPAASKAWIENQKPFKLFFWKAKKNKALPLPYPDGTERERINAMYAYYQIEYELERANRYINRLWNWIFILSVFFVGYVIYKHEK